METVRVYEIPACKMVVSGGGMFGDGVLEKYMEWMETQKRSMFPRDFLSFDGQALSGSISMKRAWRCRTI